MKAVLSFDHHFFPDGNIVRSNVGFPASDWNRYLGAFDHLTVVGREGKLTPNLHFSSLNISSRPGVYFHFLPSISSPIGLIFRRPTALQRMRALLQDADAVIARLPSELGLLAVQVAKENNKPWAVEVAGCAWDGLWNHGSALGKFYAPVLAVRTRAAISAAPFALYVTREFLQKRYPNKNGITEWASNVEIAAPSLSVLNARLEKINSPTYPLTLGLIGTLQTRYKGIHTVFDALSKVRSQLPQCVFRILGRGDPAPWQREAARFGVLDIVRFDGTRPGGSPVLNWLDEVDLYLQPSYTEGLPRSLVEAMSRACPAIGSTSGGIPELLEHDTQIKPGDAAHLASLILRACVDTDWRRHQARRNWERAHDYAANKLGERRNRFWRKFAVYAQNNACLP